MRSPGTAVMGRWTSAMSSTTSAPSASFAYQLTTSVCAFTTLPAESRSLKGESPPGTNICRGTGKVPCSTKLVVLGAESSRLPTSSPTENPPKGSSLVKEGV